MTSFRRKCVHVLATPGYAPEMCSVTIPAIERFAKRIGADFNLITERKFPSFPVNYERLQVYELGRDYDWNLNIDADMVIGESLADPTTRVPPHRVGILMRFWLESFIDISGNRYFQRDQRHIGIVDAFIVTSRLTHDLWEPLEGDFESYKHLFRDGITRRISEYCLSQNFAKYGLNFAAMYNKEDHIYHINYTSDGSQDSRAIALQKLQEWNQGSTP